MALFPDRVTNGLTAVSALASGNTVGEQMGNVNSVLAQQQASAATQQQLNASRQALLQQYPQFAAEINAADGQMLSSMVNAAWKQRMEAQQPKKPNLMNLGNGFVMNADTQQVIPPPEGYTQPKLPAIADEYNWAKEQGFTGTPQEYQVWKANLGKQKGMTVEYDPVTGFRMTQGDVDQKPMKPPTEGQAKDLNFLGRAKKAEEDLAPLETELTSFAQKRMTGLPYDIGNYLQTPRYQRAQQAGREILAIILRKDTGAAVTPQEFETYSKIYLPQPGDDAKTIAAKKRSRDTAIKGIEDGLGPLVKKDEAQPDTVQDAADYFGSP